MPRQASSPSFHQKKIITMPSRIPEHRNLPAILPPEKPSFLQTMKEGVALGVGSSIGHRIIGSIFGPPSVSVSTPMSTPMATPMAIQESKLSKLQEFEKCMKEYDDKGICERLIIN